MKSRIAVIDLGTNTFNLLIADIKEAGFSRLYSEEVPVKLGEGGINAGFITQEAWTRGHKAMKYIRQKIADFHCTGVKAVATSAIRSASNGEHFRQAVKEETGIDIEIIDGNREAQLIYEGVRSGISIDTVSMIMDIGGGSVEFIICDKNQVYWKDSYPVGAARLMEKFHHSDPISREDIMLMKQYLDESLSGLFTQCRIYQPQCLIGSAGAFETFAELTSMRYNIPYDKSGSGFGFNLDQFFEITSILLNSNRSERENMPGLVPFRIDMIIPATILSLHILSLTKIRSLRLSAYALKEGVLVNEVPGIKQTW